MSSVILFALITYVGWGIGDIFGTIAARKLGAYSTTFWALVLRILIFSIYIPFTLSSLSNLTPFLMFLIILLGIILIIGALAFNEGLATSNPSLVGTIASSYVIITVLLSIIFLKESINFFQIIAIGTIFLGLVLSSLNFSEIKKGKFLLDKGVILAIITMLSWGIYFAFIKIVVNKIGWFWPSYLSYFLFPLIFLFMKNRKIKLIKPNYKTALIPLFIAVIILGSADFSFNLAINRGLTSLVAPIAGSYPTLFVILAFLFFKDPIKKQQIVGIFFTLVGIVLLSFLSY